MSIAWCAPPTERKESQIQRNLEVTFGLWDETAGHRIVPIVGDLAKPFLGVPYSDFKMLASEMDVIYHDGALINFTYPYVQIKPANVLGTQEVLRLACLTMAKHVELRFHNGRLPGDQSPRR